MAAGFGVSGQAAGERVAGIAAQALDELQDYVNQATHGPWPGERTPPRAYAEVRDAALHLWYGETGADGRGCSDAARSRWPASSPADSS